MKHYVEVSLHAEDSSYATITCADEVVEALREVKKQINENRETYGPVMKLNVDGIEDEP